MVDEEVPGAVARCRKIPLHALLSSREEPELISHIISLERICLKSERLSGNECRQIPQSIRKIRDLLILHYDIMQGIGTSIVEDFPLCLPKVYADLAARLHVVGTFLRIHYTRLLTIMERSGQEMADVMFKETMGLSAPQAESAKEVQKARSSRQWTIVSPCISEARVLASCHRASVKYLLLVSPLWMCVAKHSSNDIHKQLAWNRLVEFSTKNIEIRAFVDNMSYILQPIILGPDINTFLMNNGIQYCVFSWVTSYGTGDSSPYATILEHIDPDIWRSQSSDCIMQIMNILLGKLETLSAQEVLGDRDVSETPDAFIKTPPFQYILFTIYSINGLRPFHYAAGMARYSLLFQSLTFRIGRHAQRCRDSWEFGRQVDKCTRLTTGSVDRYTWASCGYAARRFFLEDNSCDNARCPYKRRFREWFDSGRDLSDEEERELDRWGEKMKLCAGCREVLYCCKNCQREGWTWHKTYCLKGWKHHSLHSAPKEELPA